VTEPTVAMQKDWLAGCSSGGDDGVREHHDEYEDALGKIRMTSVQPVAASKRSVSKGAP
jgi:hypothetical protein